VHSMKDFIHAAIFAVTIALPFILYFAFVMKP
jgi:hypothetical protein